MADEVPSVAGPRPNWAWRHPIRYGLFAGAVIVVAGVRIFPGELWPVPFGASFGVFCWWLVTSSRGHRWAASLASHEQAVARGESPPPSRRALTIGFSIGAIPGALVVVGGGSGGRGQALLLLVLGALVGLGTAGLWAAVVRALRRKQGISTWTDRR